MCLLLERKQEDKKNLVRMAGNPPRTTSVLNFFIHVILIYVIQIFEFRHVLEGFYYSLCVANFPCILLTTYEYGLLSFLAIYFQINLHTKD